MCFSQLSVNNTGPETGAQSFHQMCPTGFFKKTFKTSVFTVVYLYVYLFTI